MIEGLDIDRDYNYVLLFFEQGNGSVIVNLNEVSSPVGHIYHILPDLVHHCIRINEAILRSLQ